ncbi:Voltage-gated Ion Channel (VIC) Superfamily [Phytophthora cinnamomi]|uniref:Voltage-gated Ion Channel (VIC) Superfamily n=1 Tax=Phytophthora cinnamomi TaxID=4785 RepID=UPI00355977A4|nr:Voltage-gated Ion Channel (VIC) Superfamily [Phytophthora cinnamomi]
MAVHNDVAPIETAAAGANSKAQSQEKPGDVPAGRSKSRSSRLSQLIFHRRNAISKKKYLGADYACFNFFPRDHWLRRRLILLVTHRYFDRFIVFAIIMNSIILAMSDFSVVDNKLNPARKGFAFRDGVVVPATSLLNTIVSRSEIPFTSIFTAECLLKILAMGFIRNEGAYLRDSWNVLDFVVVISSLVAILPAVPNVSAIRTIRVLRPLRSLSMIPGMRTLISALLKALPALGNVVVLQVFLFFMFAILGNQLFGGNMTRRCRLTEFPVLLPVDEQNPHGVWPVPDDYLNAVLADPGSYRCLIGPVLEVESGDFVKETSPWYKAQPCFWPVDQNYVQICARPGYSGNFQCVTGEFCGGNYDVYGNARFLSKIVMEDAMYLDALDYGLTTFDDIGHAMVTFFEVITDEGWTNIMYMCMDATEPDIAALFYIAFIVFDSVFVMNLTLAVIADEFNIEDGPPSLTDAEKKMLQLKAAEDHSRFKPSIPWLYYIVSHPLFSVFMMVAIFANTVVLSLDHYPMSDAMNADLEMINFALSCVFVAEMIIKLARNWRSLRELLEMIGRAVAGIANFGVLLFIFIYIYALIGMQFFGNTMRFDNNGYPTPYNVNEYWFGTVPRINFDTFLWSLISVFKIITADNWNEDIYDIIRGNGMYAALYPLSLMVFGNFIMMNLFLALLLDKFSTSDDEDQTKIKEMDAKKLARKMSSMKVAPLAPSIPEHSLPRRSDPDKAQPKAAIVYQQFNRASIVAEDNGETLPMIMGESATQIENLVDGPPVLATVSTVPGPSDMKKPVELKEFILNHSSKSTRIIKQLAGAKEKLESEMTPRSHAHDHRNAMITFFEMSTTENWGLLMVACIDAPTEVDMQPIRDRNMWWAGFFIIFMMFGSFFVVNLFVGVIIENFNKMTDALGGAFLLTSDQKKWLKAQKAAAQVGPQLILKPFPDPIRRKIFYFVRRKRFEWFIMICIIVNTLLMAAQHYGQSTAQTTTVNILNEFFAAVFTVEAVLKIAAYGFAYFEDNWNRFDFFVVAVFRVTRIIRLVKASKGIRHILNTLYLALPGLSNVTSILVLMLFIYTTMGVQMFAKVALGDNIDMHANFQTFGRGFLFMIRAATGESWDDCMHDYVSSPDGCVDDPPYDPTMCGFNNSATCVPLNGCGNPIAYLFFCSFTLLCTYVMLNVTVAVILESFSVSNEDEEPLFDSELLGEFQTKWAEVDPKAKGFIPASKLYAIFTILDPPLVKADAVRDKRSFLRFVCGLRLPMYEGETIYFTDTLLAMTREMVKETVADELNAIGSITPAMDDMPSRQRLHYQAHEYFAVRQIQRAVAAWLRFKRQIEKKYMDEYKSKIKKGPTRPKKQRGAVVVTTG